MISKTLLIVWIYYPAVGHLVEALGVAANYYKSNPNLKIKILVHHETPYKIGNYCSFISSIHPLDLSNYKTSNGNILGLSPEEFDYVIFPRGLKYAPKYFPEPFLSCNLYLQKYFKAKIWSGYNDSFDENPIALKFQPYSSFKIKIPDDKITVQLTEPIGYPLISVLLKGASKQSIWPTSKTWHAIFKHIKNEYPDARFLITGISNVHTTTKKNIKVVKYEIGQFVRSIPGAINYYDIGLENQLGLIQKSDVFMSPHTGFAFLAPCLGTPWLALSGGEWEEDMPAMKPFYSVLPSCKKYPCHSGDIKLECKVRLGLKQPIKCMIHLNNKKDDILFGLKKLISNNYSFHESFRDYELSAIRNNVNLKKIWRLSDYNNL